MSGTNDAGFGEALAATGEVMLADHIHGVEDPVRVAQELPSRPIGAESHARSIAGQEPILAPVQQRRLNAAEDLPMPDPPKRQSQKVYISGSGVKRSSEEPMIDPALMLISPVPKGPREPLHTPAIPGIVETPKHGDNKIDGENTADDEQALPSSKQK